MSKAENKVSKKDQFKGTVKKLTLSGALVDIGRDKPAVLPISQLKKEKVKRVEDVLKVGQEIEAWVRRVDEEKGLVELTMLEPLALEWRDIKAGMKVSGKVEKIENFGAFINIGSERPGLVHISEMSHEYVRNPEDVLTVGNDVEAQVLGVDRKKKQIKLSIKALQEDPAGEMVEDFDDSELEAIPTAMESALRKAMGESEDESPDESEISKKKKAESGMDDILARTLEQRAKS